MATNHGLGGAGTKGSRIFHPTHALLVSILIHTNLLIVYLVQWAEN